MYIYIYIGFRVQRAMPLELFLRFELALAAVRPPIFIFLYL